MAGRKVGYKHAQSTRDKIQAALIINRLVAIGMGEIDATATQVNALKTLLNKVLPDLQSVEIEAEVEARITEIRKTIVDPRADA